MKTNLGLVLGLAIVLFADVVRAAGPFTVDTVNDTHDADTSDGLALDANGATSLRAAIEQASASGGVTTINLPAGTYNLSLGDLLAGTLAGTTIYLHGTDTAATTIVHQNQSGLMVFNVDPNVVANVVVAMDNVTLSGGSENENDPDGFGGNGGAILAGGSTTASGNILSLTNVIFDHNYCSPVSNVGASGGAIDMTGGGNLNLDNCTFTGNEASKFAGQGSGGAIYFDAGFATGNVSIQNSTFSGNLAHGAQGGAIYLAGGSGNTYRLTGNTFADNTAGTQGGAIYLSTGNLTANFNRIEGNSASTASGIYMSTGTNPARSADLRDNWWGANGGPAGTGADTCFPTTSSSPPPPNGQITFSPWLELNAAASPNAIAGGASTTVTASFLTDSAGQNFLASQITALIGLPVAWVNAAHGIVSSQQITIQPDGTAAAVFTAGTLPTDGGINMGKLEAKVDNVQNGDSAATVSITIYLPPTVTSANATTFTVGINGSFTATASGPPTPDLSVSSALPNGVTFNTGSGVLSGTPDIGTGGTYPLVITATNLAGTNTQNFTLTVNEAAAISSANNATFTAGMAGSYTVTASGFPPPTLSEAGTLPAGVGFTNASGVLAGSAAFGTGGIYLITLSAHNGVGSDASQSFTLTVNESPVIDCPASLSTKIPGGACVPSIPFAASATGFPTPVFSYKLGANPIVSPTTFPLGLNFVTVTATNVAGTDTCTFVVNVVNGPLPVLKLAQLEYAFAGYSTNSSDTVTAYSNLVSMKLTWPVEAACFLLQSSTNSLTGWMTIPTGGSNTVEVPVDPGQSNVFYRLIAAP